MKHQFLPKLCSLLMWATAVAHHSAHACTGISLKAADGGVVCARTVEWALGDAHHDTLVLFPRNHAFTGLTPGGENGLKWKGRHGFVSLTAYGQGYGPDGLNEAGLYVGVYYFPGYASYAPYDAAQAERSLSVGDFMRWLLSSFTTVAEVRANLDKVRVVNVADERFGGAPLPFHWKIADPTGASIVIEIVDGGQVKIHDALLGVISNSPEYDWHLTNLRNYLGLSGAPKKSITLDDKAFAPLGGGSGLMGLPGDFTPPSRFVRALALTASARPLEKAEDAVFEAFRILDNFNIPVGATAAGGKIARDITSATQITTASDLKNRVLYFHTMDNRQIQKLDLGKIDFSTVKHQLLKQGAVRRQEVRELLSQP
ncbi:MAG: linear amide C-N hydrolase [Verrucomicrobia bacterium]|nr:linear amide C-N hydrolase [Verrucomicrobiota bacterium]